MKFAIYLPPQSETGLVPVIYWLSGLTCNELNFIQKAGAQKYAAHHGIAVVCPDTSPSKEILICMLSFIFSHFCLLIILPTKLPVLQTAI